MAPPGPIFILGAGCPICTHIARLFATHNFTRIVFFSSSLINLHRAASAVTSTTPSTSVYTYAVDVTDHRLFTSTLRKAVSEAGAPEVVIYNAVRMNCSKFGEYSPAELLEDLNFPNLGLYTTASVLVPHLQALARSHPDAHPALFVTSSALIYQPIAPMFSVSMAQAAQASLVKVLAKDNAGVVHVALMMARGVGDLDDPSDIAAKFWELYEQKKGSWEVEIRCGW